MKHTEFWAVLDRAFPDGRGRALAQDLVLVDLGNLTAQEALTAGVAPIEIWKAIVAAMDLPQSHVYLHRVDPKDLAKWQVSVTPTR
ncbi:DUF3046 domain-containing protein [Arcanobacterium bovis]|uniref:DUF3046 domain-containing protein n=1 Tax=Arcanobacterium bovis TaxID=2529275 RepID=A0A4Q9V101_9ACTO|nr:DUF3046 domain-containing protein [Arcanobacterium bovis]TBW22741.1 DUF3046 domain-containing protein [Arcanobacterium bovis]